MHSLGNAGDMAGNEVADRKLTLRVVQLQEIRSEWPFVREHLAKVLRKSKEPWIPEDVYAALIAGTDALLIAECAGEKVGALVVRKEIEQWSGKPYLFLWCISLESGFYDQTYAELANFARSVGVKSIRGESPRLGWNGRARLLSATYEVEV